MKVLLPAFLAAFVAWGQTLGQQSSLIEVRLGSQIWSAKNLSVETFRNGDPIAEAKTAEEWQKAAQLKIPVWCYYNNDPKMNNTYGKLYNWYAVSDPRGLAPEGWEIPSEAQWSELVEWLGGKTKAAYALKSRNGWAGNGNGTNISDFNAKPGGGRYYDGSFEGLEEYANWWTATEFNESYAYDRNLNDGTSNALAYYSMKEDGFSVRCIRQSTSQNHESPVVNRMESDQRKGNGSSQP